VGSGRVLERIILGGLSWEGCPGRVVLGLYCPRRIVLESVFILEVLSWEGDYPRNYFVLGGLS